MKQWGLLLGAALALGSAAVVIAAASGRIRRNAGSEEVPRLIDDCFDRIHQLESELRRLNPDALG
jgi:hypothetical protein